MNKKISIWAITPGGCSLGFKLKDRLENCDFYMPARLENYFDIQIRQDEQTRDDKSISHCINKEKFIKIETSEDEFPYDHNTGSKFLKRHNGNIFFFKSLAKKIKEKFTEYTGHVFIFSTGIAVRIIAPLLRSKLKDPGVVVLDEKACHSISLVSGHIGDANNLAEKIAEITGADPVITTATDVNHLPSIDMIAKRNNLIIENPKMIKIINMAFLENQKINLIDPYGIVFPHIPNNFISHEMEDISYKKNQNDADTRPDYLTFGCGRMLKKGCAGYKKRKKWELGEKREQDNDKGVKKNNNRIKDKDQTPEFPSILCSDKIIPVSRETLILRPLSLTVGIGCNRNTSSYEIASFLKLIFNGLLLSMKSIELLASSDIKQDEYGLLNLADKMDLKIKFYDKKQLNSVTNIQNPSVMVEKHIGVKSVCEAAAILASGNGELIVPKMKKGNVTLAVARKHQNYL